MDELGALVQLGEVGILAAALLALVFTMRPGIKALTDTSGTLVRQNEDAARREERAFKALDAATDQARSTAEAMKGFQASLDKQTDALVQLVKAQPDTIAQIVKAGETQADRTIRDLTTTINTREAAVEAGIARIEAAVSALKEELASGAKAHRLEMIGKLDAIMHEITSLKPPPPPHLVKPLHALEPAEKEAAA